MDWAVCALKSPIRRVWAFVGICWHAWDSKSKGSVWVDLRYERCSGGRYIVRM